MVTTIDRVSQRAVALERKVTSRWYRAQPNARFESDAHPIVCDRASELEESIGVIIYSSLFIGRENVTLAVCRKQVG